MSPSLWQPINTVDNQQINKRNETKNHIDREFNLQKICFFACNVCWGVVYFSYYCCCYGNNPHTRTHNSTPIAINCKFDDGFCIIIFWLFHKFSEKNKLNVLLENTKLLIDRSID